jgi:TolB-like protein/DNA-binding winged helix-turn-helix (wHTH) protein/Tfp pilus assembly protein PilF
MDGGTWHFLTQRVARDYAFDVLPRSVSIVTTRPPSPPLCFGRFEFNLETGELRKSGIKIRLQGQSLRILQCLLEEPRRLWSREDLRSQLWPNGTFVEFDHSLNVAVNRLRERLGDSTEKPRYIETVPGVGYRFVAPVESAIETPHQDLPGPELAAPGVPPPTRYPKLMRSYLAVGCALLLAFLAWLAWKRAATHPVAAEESVIRSVAVLPLTEIGAGINEEYFADGMTEEMITELGRMSSFRVISRTSVMQYKNSVRSVPEIGRQLNVDALIEGTVRRSEGRVRITARLVSTAPERLIWEKAYEGDMRDVLMLQSDVAHDIAGNIRTRIAPQQVPGAVAYKRLDPETHEDYLRGQYFLDRRTAEAMNTAVEYFQRALQRDPQYAQAHVGLALAYELLGSYEVLPPDKSYPLAMKFANKALELDDTLSEAYAARAIAEDGFEFDWAAADRDLRRAIELDPNSVLAHHQYGEYFIGVGNPERAIAELKIARELDPLSLPLMNAIGRMYREAHQYDEAMRQCKQSLDLDPNFAMGHWCLGQVYLAKRQFAEATSELRRADELGTTPLIVCDLGCVYAAAGKKMEAWEVLNSLKKRSRFTYVSPYLIASIYSALGENDEAFKWLEKAYDTRDGISYLVADPMMDPLRSDPRYARLVERLHLPQS